MAKTDSKTRTTTTKRELSEKAFEQSFQQRVDFLHQLRSVYHSTHQYPKAVACAEKMIRLKPDYVDAYHLLALASIGLGEHETARQAWQRILTIDPNDSRAIRNLRGLENQEE